VFVAYDEAHWLGIAAHKESWTYDQYNRIVTHVDFNGDTAWELYGNSPQWGGLRGSNPGALIAEYRYAPGHFVQPDNSTSPASTDWQERTEYLYDDAGLYGGTDAWDPDLTYSLPAAENLALGRVVEVQEWTRTKKDDGTYDVAMADFTHTTYDVVTGQVATITSSEGVINYAYDPVTGRKVRMWTGSDPGENKGVGDRSCPRPYVSLALGTASGVAIALGRPKGRRLCSDPIRAASDAAHASSP
jgi:hypothetical protein